MISAAIAQIKSGDLKQVCLELLRTLADAIALILEDRREEGLRGVPPDAVREKVTVK